LSESIDNRLPGRASIIAHLHTTASNAEASDLDARIGKAVREVDGEHTTIAWAECFTSIDRVLGLLKNGRRSSGAVDMVLVTDHMRARSHRHPATHLEAAAREHRLALGAEFATCTRDLDGIRRKGPEILAYGGTEPVTGPAGSYFGLDRRLIEELYDTCLDREWGELDTLRARSLLLARGVAHALAHPFDGHALSFEGTFDIIGEFTFIEALNGGFYEASARVLGAFIALNNALLRGSRLPVSALSPMARRIVERIHRRNHPLFAWSGSDAHHSDFDRVVLTMAAPAGRSPESLRPNHLFRAMLGIEDAAYRQGAASPFLSPREGTFVTVGRPATPLRRLVDVLAIIGRNLKQNHVFSRNPVTLARLLRRTAAITRDELRGYTVRQASMQAQLRTEFDPVSLLSCLEPPLLVQRGLPLEVVAAPVAPAFSVGLGVLPSQPSLRLSDAL
jgi:hypothetical protein